MVAGWRDVMEAVVGNVVLRAEVVVVAIVGVAVATVVAVVVKNGRSERPKQVEGRKRVLLLIYHKFHPEFI